MDNLNVYVRVRPLTNDEKEKRCQSCVTIQDESTIILNVPEGSRNENASLNTPISSYNLKFTKVFGPNASQKEFFSKTILDSVNAFLNGQDSLVISHGPRKSGRTYTIQGDRTNPGLLPRLVDVVFNSLQNCMMKDGLLQLLNFSQVKKATTAEKMFERYLKQLVLNQSVQEFTSGRTGADNGLSISDSSVQVTDHDVDTIDHSVNEMFEKAFATLDKRLKEEETLKVSDKYSYSIWASFAEINGENVYDLLDNDVERKNNLPVEFDQKGKPYIEGLLRISVATADEALRVVLIGQRNHVMSARKDDYVISHFLFCLELVRVASQEDPSLAVVNRLLLCDVGSPDDFKLSNGKKGADQSVTVDPSYLVLERCIDALKQKSEERIEIPFEESKLTQLLSPFFMHKLNRIKIAITVGPTVDDYSYTLNTLKFSSLAGEAVSKNSFRSGNCIRIPLNCNEMDVCVSEFAKEARNSFVDSELLDLMSLINQKKERDEKRITCIYDYLVDAVQIMRAMLISQHNDKMLLADQIRNQLQQEFFDHVVEIEEHLRSVNSKQKCFKKYWWKQYIQMMLLNIGQCNNNFAIDDLGNKDKDESHDGKYDMSVENRLLNVEVKSLRENLQKLSRTVAEMQLENSQLRLSSSSKNEESSPPNHVECSKVVQEYRNEIEELKKLRKLCTMRNEVNEQLLSERICRLEKETYVRQKLLLNREQTIADLERQKQQLSSKLKSQECLIRLASKRKSCSCHHAEGAASDTEPRKRRLGNDGYLTTKLLQKPLDLDHRWKVSGIHEDVDDDEWFLSDLMNSHTDDQHGSRLPQRKMKSRLIVRCERLEFTPGKSCVNTRQHTASQRTGNDDVPKEKHKRSLPSTTWQRQLVCRHTGNNGENQNGTLVNSEERLLDGWCNKAKS